jgi:hypothetical protein
MRERQRGVRDRRLRVAAENRRLIDWLRFKVASLSDDEIAGQEERYAKML